MEGGSHDITTPVPTTVASRADAWRLQGAGCERSGYVYARETRAEADMAKVLTLDEARRIVVNVAKLLGLLGAVRKAEEASP
jgi:hypothetical protein